MRPVQNSRVALDLDAIEQLIPLLEGRGYQVVGPTVRDGAIIYDTVRKLEDLPVGWTDEQEAGRYRLKKRDDGALLATSWGRRVGRSSFTRLKSGCSRFKGTEGTSVSSTTRCRRRAMPSWECAPVK